MIDSDPFVAIEAGVADDVKGCLVYANRRQRDDGTALLEGTARLAARLSRMTRMANAAD